MPKNKQPILPADSLAREVILERLAKVLDPELDKSILQLGFIESLQVLDGDVTVDLKLPTCWCSANFVYMMAEDIRRVLLTVESVRNVTLHLGDHFAAKEIENSVNIGKTFMEAFPSEAAGNLDDLRRTFLRKGFASRQERFLRNLKIAGLSSEEICALRISDVSTSGESCVVRRGSGEPVEVGPAEVARRYLQRREEMGLDCSPTALLIADLKGQPISTDRLETYFTEIRTARLSLDANASLCSALLGVRTLNA